MKLKHIALSVKKTDIGEFYQDVMKFEVARTFVLNNSLARNIFGIEKEIPVTQMSNGFVDLELFEYPYEQTGDFDHICLESTAPEMVFMRAKNAGYDYYIHKGGRGITYFIRDGSGNLFEVKER